MSYEVIARKWRPKSFSQLIGQNHVSQTLLNALKNDRLPQALLFNGPRGTGKTSTARIFASTLRCPNLQDFSPCGVCSECEEVITGKSINVVEVDGASNNGVDSVRELRDSVSYMPSSGKYKIYIIDEVHMLSTSAFNALLKTLEEPPAHVIFIMATTEIHKVPNTILSRCQKFDFRRVSSQEIVKSLEKICKHDNINFEAEALWSIARQADGSMRDSQSLLDQVISFCDNNIKHKETIEALGLTDRKWVVSALQAVISRNHKEILSLVKTLILSGQDPNLFVKDLLQEIRNALICKLNPEIAHSIIDLSDTAIEELTEMGASLSSEDIQLIFDMTLKGARDVVASSSAQLVLEMLLLRMASAPRIVDIEQVRLPAMTSSTANRPSPAMPSVSADNAQAAPSTAQTPAPVSQQKQAPKPTITANEPLQPSQATTGASKAHVPANNSAPIINSNSPAQEQWLDLVTQIKNLNPIVAAKLEHSSLISKDNDTLTIAIPAKMKFLTEQVKDKDFLKKLENYVSTLWGKSYNFHFTDTSEKKNSMSPSQLKQHKSNTAKLELRKKVEAHPVIKQAHEVFKTEIIDIRDL